MTPSYSRQIAKESGSNFYFSFFFLSKEKRDGIMTVYAFSRLVDDAVDEASDVAKARLEIGLWRKRVESCYGQKDALADHPLLPELSSTIRRFGIPRKYFDDLLTGMEMDLVRKRYSTFSELEDYCYHVAGTIGLLCNHLFGFPDDQSAKEHAVLLGKAFQITNILRDLGSDAQRGRIYIPREDYEHFGLSEENFLKGETSTSFLNLMHFEAERAEAFFRKASETLPDSKGRKLVPARIMSRFYRRILKKLQKENFPVFRKKISLSAPEKLALVAGSVFQSL